MSIRTDPEAHEFKAILALAGDLSRKRVLEIGCGSGRITHFLARHAAHITAIDPNEARIARAIAKTPPALVAKIRYQAIPLEALPPTEKFDLALLSWSL